MNIPAPVLPMQVEAGINPVIQALGKFVHLQLADSELQPVDQACAFPIANHR